MNPKKSLTLASGVDLIDSIPSTNVSHSKPARKNSFFSGNQTSHQKYFPKSFGSTGSIADTASVKFFKNFRIHENSKNEGLKYSFSSHAEMLKDKKMQISPSNSNYQTPRSTANQNNYNVTVININKMDINNFKINEQNGYDYTTSKGTNTPEDVGPTNYQTVKEKDSKIMELKKEINEIKASLNNAIQEKQRLHPEEVIAKFYNKLQMEELLKQLLSHLKGGDKLDSKELGSAKDEKTFQSFTVNRVPSYFRNDSSKDNRPPSGASNRSKTFFFEDRNMEALPRGGSFKRHFPQNKTTEENEPTHGKISI